MTPKLTPMLLKALFLVSALVALAAAADIDEKDVVVLTAESFDEVINNNDNVLVEFYAPWCGHCKRLAPEYAAAATRLKAKNANAVIAKIDCDTHKDIGTRFEVQGFPTLKWFVKGTPGEYKGGRTAPDIFNWVYKRVSAPVTYVNNKDDAEKFFENNEYSIVGFFDASSKDDISLFERVAIDDDNVNYALVTDAAIAADLGYSIPSIAGFRPEVLPHQTRSHKMQDSLSEENLVKFSNIASMGLVTEFTPQSANKIFGHPVKTQVLLFTDAAKSETKGIKDDFFAAAGESAGKAVFVTVDGGNQQVTEYFGVKKEHLPVVFVVHATEGGLSKFRLPNEPTKDNLISFLNEYFAGNLKPHLKSDPIPASNNEPVKVVVGESFEEIVNDATKDVFVEFYAPWCGHCQQLAPIFDKLAKDLLPVESVTVAKMDATANDAPPVVNIKGFPTLLLFKANDKTHPVPFDGERTVKGMKNFISTHASIPFTMPKKNKKKKE